MSNHSISVFDKLIFLSPISNGFGVTHEANILASLWVELFNESLRETLY